MNARKFLFILTLYFFHVNGQEKKLKKIDFAKIEIEVPSNYNSSSENQIENDNFSAQWIYLPGESFSSKMKIKIMNQIESQLKPSMISEIHFFSSGEKFIGNKYYFENVPLKYRIYAYGIINKQLLILNLGFKNDPEKDTNFDSLMLKFIKFEK